MAVFTSTLKRPSIVIDPGGKKPVKIGDGQYEYKTFEEIKITFDNHKFDSSLFFKKDEQTLLTRGWTEDKICQRIRSVPKFGLEYFEIKPPTREEKLKAAQALKAQAEELIKEAEELSTEEIVEDEKTAAGKVKIYIEKCRDCDYQAEAYSQEKAKAKLRSHRIKLHRTV